MGIIATLKVFAPLTLYTASLAGILCALIGKVRWALAVVIFLLPLRNVVEKIQDFPAGSQIIDLLFISMFVGWMVSSASSSEPFIKKSSINAPVICMCIYLLISLIIGTHSLTGQIGIDRSEPRVQDWKNFTLLPILFFLTANNLPDKKWVWRIFWVMMSALVLVNYYTVSQVMEYTSLLSRAKISGTFQFLGPNEVAAFLNQIVIVLTGIYFFLKRSWIKLFLLAMIIADVYCILFLYSRGAYIGLSVGFLILFLFKNQKMLIPLILLLVFWQVILPDKAIERIKGTTSESGQLDESSELRLVMWGKAMELFKQSPLVGIGYGVFRSMDFGTGLHDTHNIYVKILAEQGIIGIILFFVVIFAFINQGYFLFQKGDDDMARGLGLGFSVSMITLMINNIFGDRWAYFELSAYTWAFAGLVARLSQLSIAAPALAAQTQDKELKEKPLLSKIPGRKPRKSYYK